MAREELGAKVITLNTIAPEELAVDSPMRIKTGKPVPKASNSFAPPTTVVLGRLAYPRVLLLPTAELLR